MTTKPLAAVLGRVHGLLAARNSDDRTDGQLLEAYVVRHDAAAFAVLLRRHGALVLSVCRGVLHHEHDAEDAFQAAFLILARKASSIRRLASVGGWLYQVAYNVALKTRAARRPGLERQAPDVPASDPLADLARRELCDALGEELRRLPEKYRLPLVLCYLEALTTGEAARRLRWPAGTVKVRLMQARELLRKRLSRRGFSLAVGGLVSLLMLRAAAAAPAALVRRTAEAAVLFRTGVTSGVSEQTARLAESYLLAMRTIRLKGLLTGLLVAVAVTAGAGGLLHQPETANGATPQAPDRPSRTAPPEETVAVAAEDDPLPTDAAATPPEASVRLRQDRPVVAVAVSPDGKLLAAAGTDGRIIVWDMAARRRLSRLPAFEPSDLPQDESRDTFTRRRFACASLFFPEGRSVAAGVRDGLAGKTAVVVWEADTGRELRSLPTDHCFTFVPGGALAAADRGHGLVLWEPAAGRERLLPDVTTGTVRAVALAADGRTVALAEDDRTIQLRDATSGELLQRFRPEWDGPIPRPHDVFVFSPDAALVTVGGSWDGTVPLWEVRTGRLLRTLTVSAGLVHSVVLSPDGRTLAAAARDESIRVLDVTTGTILHTLSRPHGEAGITTIAFAPDGKTIVSGATDGTICCWPLP